ncbi:MAG: hypothetical protein V4591_10590 [Bdellovibrionota bacterium]
MLVNKTGSPSSVNNANPVTRVRQGWGSKTPAPQETENKQAKVTDGVRLLTEPGSGDVASSVLENVTPHRVHSEFIKSTIQTPISLLQGIAQPDGVPQSLGSNAQPSRGITGKEGDAAGKLMAVATMAIPATMYAFGAFAVGGSAIAFITLGAGFVVYIGTRAVVNKVVSASSQQGQQLQPVVHNKQVVLARKA